MTYQRRIKRQRNRKILRIERYLADVATLVSKALPSMLQTPDRQWFTLTYDKRKVR